MPTLATEKPRNARSYLLDGTDTFSLWIPETCATELSRENPYKCAIAERIKQAMRDQLGIDCEVVVLRTRVRFTIAGQRVRYKMNTHGRRNIRKFDNPADGVFQAGWVTFSPPNDRDEDGNIKGGGHGKDRSERKSYIQSDSRHQNHNRRRAL